MHEIDPPKRKLKRTTDIELKCYNCGHLNFYVYVFKLRGGA
jgi:hypothetical protein